MLPPTATNVQLTPYSDPTIVTTSVNVPNIMTLIIKWKAPRGNEYLIPSSNEVEGREYRGVKLVLDLRDAAGVKLPQSTKIRMTYKNPGYSDEDIVRTIQHGVFGQLDSTAQQSRDYISRILDAFNLQPSVGDGLRILEQGELSFLLEGPVAIDHSKSTIIVFAGEIRAVK